MHDLSGHCLHCARLFNTYPNFNDELRTWFSALQIENPELHISCAGRGKIEQEALFQRGATKAHYGHSSHNFNAAFDVFFLIDGNYNLDAARFSLVIVPALYPSLTWYGSPKAIFYERPHIELASWKELVSSGQLVLVE